MKPTILLLPALTAGPLRYLFILVVGFTPAGFPALFHHPFFANARRIWHESATEGHGQPFSNISVPGFTQVYHELIKTLLGPPAK